MLPLTFSAVCGAASDAEARDLIARESVALDVVPVRSDVVASSRVFPTGDLCPVRLLDEVTAWYCNDTHAPLGAAAAALWARVPFLRARPRLLVEPARPPLFAVVAPWGRYPSLNASLFATKEVAPLRDVDRLAAFLDAVGITLPAGHTVSALLWLTGGVGRSVAAVCTSCDRAPGDALAPDAAVMDDALFRALMVLLLGSEESAHVLAVWRAVPRACEAAERRCT